MLGRGEATLHCLQAKVWQKLRSRDFLLNIHHVVTDNYDKDGGQEEVCLM